MAILGFLVGSAALAIILSNGSRRTEPGVMACIDARLHASDEWRAFARAADEGATTQENLATAADLAATRARTGSDYASAIQLQATAEAQQTLAHRFRARATNASEVVAHLGNPYLELVAARGWGSNPNDPAGGEMQAAAHATEAAWIVCRDYCYDMYCSGLAPTSNAHHLPAPTE